MNLPLLCAKNVLRNRFRTTLTLLGVAVALLAFVLLRTVISAWTVAAEYAAKDRIGTRHKITFVMALPKRYIETIRAAPGITVSTWANWFGGKHPRREQEFFGNMAVDSKTFFRVYDEMAVPKEQMEQWLSDRKGAIIGDALAKKFDWKVGDKVTLLGTIFPGDWQFNISGIYTATRKSVDRSSLYFHWDYLNESLPERARDQIGWVISRVNDSQRTADISAALDKLFEDKEIQTLSMSERAMNTSFLGMMSAILSAIDIVSLVILAIMMLILGNTIAMGVRERTSEYGVLRAIGFLPRHLAVFVFGEALITGLMGGVLGLLLAFPLVSVMGRWIEENMGAFFPYFQIAKGTAVAALLLSLVVALLAAMVPAYRAARLHVVDALRRVG